MVNPGGGDFVEVSMGVENQTTADPKHLPTLTGNKLRAIQLLHDGVLNKYEVAAQLQITRRTLTRWETEDADFMAAMDEYRAMVYERWLDPTPVIMSQITLREGMPEAAQKIRDIAVNGKSAKDQIAAFEIMQKYGVCDEDIEANAPSQTQKTVRSILDEHLVVDAEVGHG